VVCHLSAGSPRKSPPVTRLHQRCSPGNAARWATSADGWRIRLFFLLAFVIPPQRELTAFSLSASPNWPPPTFLIDPNNLFILNELRRSVSPSGTNRQGGDIRHRNPLANPTKTGLDLQNGVRAQSGEPSRGPQLREETCQLSHLRRCQATTNVGRS
jgi:hypothetical protein